jgi:hypothetical protein
MNGNEPKNSKAAPVGRRWMSSLLITGSFIFGGCHQKPPIPNEGDVAVWMHSPELIIKAKLGQRREHVIADPRIDHRFYEPEYERFIGQFPLDYAPIPFPKFTEAEHRDFIAEHDSKIHAVKSLHPLEFNLILNGATTKATDASPYGGEGIDDPNQVKVILNGPGILPNDAKLADFDSPDNPQNLLKTELMKELDADSIQTEYGLDCYNFKEQSRGKRCFGHSTHPSISGFEFHLSTSNRNIMVWSRKSTYRGILIQWFTEPKNINRAKDIDAAIWRLLDAWNIAPHHTKNYLNSK